MAHQPSVEFYRARKLSVKDAVVLAVLVIPTLNFMAFLLAAAIPPAVPDGYGECSQTGEIFWSQRSCEIP